LQFRRRFFLFLIRKSGALRPGRKACCSKYK
jgi:hypothetical protein